ncbi:TRAP transporter substrate-binding protein DctP [uncultured Marinobacter sp.]|uniref:TRAP transporter substrate-binding protein DctP n=1 Tax=uncultured Marinobacter sp. TaxID=187379 RepID=UPI0030DCD853
MMFRHLPITMITIVAAFILSGCSDSSPIATGKGTEPTIWRFALEEIGGSVQDAYAQEFRSRIHEISDGAVQVEIYPYGSIGSSPQLTQLVRDGRVHMAFASPGHLAATIPETGVFNLHFVLPDDEQSANSRLASEELRGMLAEPFQARELQLLDIFNEGWMAWTANKPLRTPEDFTGLRLRTMTSPIMTDIFRAYGAEPVAMPYSEVYAGLQLKQIDGQTNPVFSILEMKFYELQEVMIQPRAARFVTTLVTSPSWYQQLPEQHQQWIAQVRDGLRPYVEEKQQQYNAERLDQLKKSGRIRIVDLTDEERNRFRTLSLPVREIYLNQTGANGQQILDLLTRDEPALTPEPASAD